MKAIKIITALALLTGLTSLSFAGPSPDYWIRMNQAAKDKAAIEAKAVSSAKAQPAAQVASCNACGCTEMKKS